MEPKALSRSSRARNRKSNPSAAGTQGTDSTLNAKNRITPEPARPYCTLHDLTFWNPFADPTFLKAAHEAYEKGRAIAAATPVVDPTQGLDGEPQEEEPQADQPGEPQEEEPPADQQGEPQEEEQAADHDDSPAQD